MKKLIIPAFAALLTILSSGAKAQQDKFDILAPFITEEQQTLLTKLQEDIAKGEKLVSQAETQDKANAKFLNSSKKGKLKKGEKKSAEAKSFRIKATKYYERSYQSLLEIYKEVIDGLTFTYSTDKNRADELLTEAETNITEGSAKLKPYNSLSEKSLRTKTYTTLRSDMSSCKNSFESAGEKCRSALVLYGEQENKKSQAEAAELKFWNAAVSTNTVAAYQGYISKYPEGKFVDEANRRIADLSAKSKRCTSDNPDEGLAYRLQICADKKKWSPRKLHRLYKGDLTIDERQSDGYYKYWIGCYRSYTDAQAAESSLGIKQCFIVCFNEGTQIHVTEAQEIESKLE